MFKDIPGIRIHTQKMTSMREIRKTFMTSLYPESLLKPVTKSFSRLSDVCLERLKLYHLLQNSTHDLYSEQWTLSLVQALAKDEFKHLFALLDSKETSKLLADSLAECKDGGLAAASTSTESAPECSAREPLPNSLLKDYFMDDAIGHLFFGLMAGKKLKWQYIAMELRWFQLKFNLNVPEEKIIDFLTYNNLMFEASKEEILSMTDLLSFYDLDFESDNPPTILKVPFTAAPKLVINQKVVIKGGFLYFPTKRQYVRVLLDHYLTDKWMKTITIYLHHWQSNTDDRFNQMIFDDLTPRVQKILQFNYGSLQGGNLTCENIDEHASDLFPLCMSQLHNALKENNHLQHFARKEYAVFLKHAGMSYENAMTLFKTEFTKKITEEEFTKHRHEYYFSHCYGMVGSLINYPVQSCEEIIKYDTPSGKQEHGCPFAHADDKNLTNILKKHGIRWSTITRIIISRNNKQYREACSLYYTEKTGRPLASANSPNAYYACALEKFVDIEDIFQ